MDSKEYWDSVATNKTFTTPFQIEKYTKYVDKDSLIFDIGCGYGRILKILYENGYKNLIGIDFSHEMINKAKKLYPYLDFIVSNSDRLLYEDNSIDSIILVAVLTCIPNNKKQSELIKDIYRVLKKDGILYVNDFLLNETSMYIDRYKKYENKYKEYGVFETSDGGIFKHHNIEYINKLLDSYKCEEQKVLQYKTMNGHTSNGFYYIGRK